VSWSATLAVLAATAIAAVVGMSPAVAATSCRPNIVFDASPNDTYLPGSPVRSVSGHGHVISGFVRSSTTCKPIARAKLEFFHAGPDGEYSDGFSSWAGRATVFTKADGSYRFESRYPTNSANLRPHIHFRISAPGYRTANASYFARPGEPSARVMLVLAPAR
jgi:protocatechuate 3,4-dioxygenase beta subunit